MSTVRYRVTNTASSVRSFAANGEAKNLLTGESEVMELSEDEHASLAATSEFLLARLDPPVQADEPRQRHDQE